MAESDPHPPMTAVKPPHQPRPIVRQVDRSAGPSVAHHHLQSEPAQEEAKIKDADRQGAV